MNIPTASTTLDCETYESSIQCLADVYRAKIPDVERFLSALDIDREYETRKISIRGDEFLLNVFRGRFGMPSLTWESVCWFHLTRVPPSTDFAEGILPQNLALPRIWESVISAQADPDKQKILRHLRTTGVPDFQYNHKVGVALHSGPYAMLVREVAFCPGEMGNHDYLETPEIVSDICDGFHTHSGVSIIDETFNALRPCIVKFVDSEVDSDQLMRVLLYYCWSKRRGEELCYLANTCFDAKGRTIPRSAILKIEFL